MLPLISDLDIRQRRWHPVGLIQDLDGRFSAEPSPAVSRLLPIEGLRAYLALWVLVDHVLWVAGYWQDTIAGLPTMYHLQD